MDRFRNTRQPDREWWRELWPAPERTLRDLDIEPGTVVADVGCGDGYFTLPAAQFTGEASVYAVDIDETLLETVETSAAANGLTNVVTICGDARELAALLPEPVDCVLLANTFHGVENPVAFAEQISRALRPTGRFVIINWRDLPREETTVAGTERGPPEPLRMRPADTREVLTSASFNCIEEIDLPPYHYALVGHHEDESTGGQPASGE